MKLSSHPSVAKVNEYSGWMWCPRKSNPYTGMDRSLGHQDVEAPSFEDNWHMNVVRLQP